jgi:hypothetical protein
MRVSQLVSDFFEWRWAPCVGLTAGSLTFVALALLLIPTHFGGQPRAATTLNSFDVPRPQRAPYSSSLSRSLAEAERRPEEDMRGAHTQPPSDRQAPAAGAVVQRGFSPILERPELPPPAPAAVELPAPAPGSVVVIQPVPGGESRESTVQ